MRSRPIPRVVLGVPPSAVTAENRVPDELAEPALPAGTPKAELGVTAASDPALRTAVPPVSDALAKPVVLGFEQVCENGDVEGEG